MGVSDVMLVEVGDRRIVAQLGIVDVVIWGGFKNVEQSLDYSA